MPKIALTLSGAVSLGSWEAGVLDELIETLNVLYRPDDPDPWTIDVITGASAGSMTAALVARSVMFDWPGRNGRSSLHRAWVKEIDVEHLLTNVPPNALLSKDPIFDIADRLLARPTELRRAPWAPEEMKLAFTLTNMSGVDFVLPARHPPGGSHEPFRSTFFAERRIFDLGRQLMPPDRWKTFMDAAIASGNFPAAFLPHRFGSDESRWPGHDLDPWPDDFVYLDGGMFNNEPIGAAVDLARKIDRAAGHPGLDPKRKFLLVDANLNGSKRDPEFTETATISAVLQRLYAVLRGESSATDWLRAQRVNNETRWRDSLVAHVERMVREVSLPDAEAFAVQLDRQAEDIVRRKRELFGPEAYPEDYVENALARTGARFGEQQDDLSDVQRRIFRTIVFLINSVASLDKKETIDLNIIYTTPGETAGDQMMSFAGFFSQKWREHDYRVGRRRARAELPWVIEGRADPSFRYTDGSDPVYQLEEDLSNVSMAHAPRVSRERLRDGALRKLEPILKDLSPGPRWIRWSYAWALRGLGKRIAKSKLESFLEL